MKRYAFFLLLLFWYSSAFAAETISIEILNAPQQIKPGEYFTVFVDIRSDTPLEPTLGALLILPLNWQILTKKTPDAPGRGTSITYLRYVYTVATPRAAPAKDYPLVFRVWEKGLEKTSKEVKVRVEKIRKIEVTPLSYPEFLKEGQTLRMEYLIQNLGNEKEQLSIRSSRGRVEHLKNGAHLEPNESVKVLVSQIIPYTDNNMWLLNADIRISFGDSSQPVYRTRSIPVYAAKNKRSDPYLRFPIEAGGIYHLYDGGALSRRGYQLDVRGGGHLDFAKKHTLDFVARGANQFGNAVIGSYEQYSLNYEYNNSPKKRTDIALSDYSLAFTNLIELSRFGRGAKIEQQIGRLTGMVFYQEPRFFPDTKKTFGGKLAYKPSTNSTLSINYFSKYHSYNHSPDFWTNLLSTRAQIKKETLWWDVEVAAGKGNSKLDFGGFSNFNVFKRRFRFYNNIVYAGKNFYGFYTNSWLLNTSLHIALSKNITIGGIVNYNRVNPSLDSMSYNQSPYFKSNVAELIIRPNAKNRWVLSYNQLHREDRLEPKRFNFREEFARYTYYLNTKRFNLWLDGNYGYTENLLVASDTSRRKPSLRNMLQAEVRILRALSLGGNVEHLQTNRFSAQNQIQDFIYYGGNLRLQFKRYFDLSIMYRNNYALDELTEKRMFFDIQANLRLPHHLLSIVGSQAYYPNLLQQNTLYFGIKYALKINIPIAKNKNLSSLKGQILGESSIRKEGILLQIDDQKFITDAKGRFAFNNLVPGKYFFSLVRSSLETGDIPAIQTPIEMEIKADTAYRLDIPFTKAGMIVGKVSFEKSNRIGDTELKKDTPTLLAKLYNEKESHTTKINENNTFSFKEVKPGNWNITVWAPGNQDKFKIDNQQMTIEVKGEQSYELHFKVKPIERKIYFTENNFLLSTKE